MNTRTTLQAERTDTRPQLIATGESGGRCELIALGNLPGVIQSEAADDAQPAFRMLAYSGGVMFPKLNGIDWKGPVVVDLSGMRIEPSIPIHREHNRERPVGHGYPDVGRELLVDGVFSVRGDDAEQVIDGLKNGFPWKPSIGLSEMQAERVARGRTVTVNGGEFEGPILVIRSSHLDEVSFVTIPGDYDTAAVLANRPEAADTARSNSNHDAQGSHVTFSQWLAKNGHDEATLTASRIGSLHAEYLQELNASRSQDAAEINDAAGGNAAEETEPTDNATATATASRDDSQSGSNRPTATAGRQSNGLEETTDQAHHLTAARNAAADEENRCAAIREIGVSIANPVMDGGEHLTAHAMRNNWTVEQTRQAAQLSAGRARRPSAPAIHTTSQATRETVGAVQAAMMLRAGRPIDLVLPHSPHVAPWMTRPVNDPARQQIMDNAHAMRGGTMMDFAAASLRANNREVPSGFDRHSVLQAAFSTGSISAVFDQSIGSIALTAYAEAGNFAAGWTSESDALNLLPHERPRMQAAQDLSLHPTGGQADHAHRVATSETVQVDRFSRQCTIDENDFINDQFGLLAETPRDFGRAAARLVPRLVAAILLRNANLKATGRALFNATDGSLITGKPLTQPNLQAVRAALARKKDGDATLNLQATHLIVPSELGDLAIQLTHSAVISNDSGAGATNPTKLRNILPIEEARLDVGMQDPLSLTGANLAGSTSSWFLTSTDGKTIEVQYLQGTGRQPIVVVEQLSGKGEFGMNITVKHFAGAAPLAHDIIRVDAT